MELIQNVALAGGLAWASGIRLYAALFLTGLLARFGWVDLPAPLELLTHPWVLGASGFMLTVEFLADKIPMVDSLWDTVHTFIRVPAGALLAAGAIGTMDPALATVAAILGGAIASGSHATKAGTRALINTSPEPVSNWSASLAEDVAAPVGVGLAIFMPIVFLVLLAVFVLLAVWLLPRLWRGLKWLFGGRPQLRDDLT